VRYIMSRSYSAHSDARERKRIFEHPDRDEGQKGRGKERERERERLRKDVA